MEQNHISLHSLECCVSTAGSTCMYMYASLYTHPVTCIHVYRSVNHTMYEVHDKRECALTFKVHYCLESYCSLTQYVQNGKSD